MWLHNRLFIKSHSNVYNIYISFTVNLVFYSLNINFTKRKIGTRPPWKNRRITCKQCNLYTVTINNVRTFLPAYISYSPRYGILGKSRLGQHNYEFIVNSLFITLILIGQMFSTYIYIICMYIMYKSCFYAITRCVITNNCDR